MIVDLEPLMIINSMQLGLKIDEPIIDVSYKVSMDNRYHCIWILDQKL